VYPFAKTGFEPLDPNGRFAYYKSAAFKEFWDDASINRMYQITQDGTFLDVFKPIFGSGIASLNADAMVPGNFIGMPAGASVTPYQLGANLQASMQLIRKNEEDMSLSTVSAEQNGNAQPGVTATASIKADQAAQVIMGNTAIMIVDLIRQIGELTIDDILAHTTIGEVDATVPESLNMKYKTVRLQTKQDGKDINKVVKFDTSMMQSNFTSDKAQELEWKMFEDNGGMDATSIEYKVNPYKFARLKFSAFVDPQILVSNAMGTSALRDQRMVAILTNPAISPYINMDEVIRDFVLKGASVNNVDKYMKSPEEMAQAQQMAQQQGTGQLSNSIAGSLNQPAVAG
jgi:hypothetical protein